MAQIIPAAPLGSLPNEVLRTYRFLKSLPDEYLVWHHLTPWDRTAPDFLIINPGRKALLIKVSTAKADSKQPAAQMLLIGEKQRKLGQEEEQVINAFHNRLPPTFKDQITRAILFPNIRSKILASNQVNHPSSEIYWLGQDLMQNNDISLWDGMFKGGSLDEFSLENLRMFFTPEVVVPATLTVRPPDQGRHAAGLEDYLLDTVQEIAVKSELDLPSQQEKASKDMRVNIINGVAGSGKTLILLYRLRLLYSLFPTQRFLVLTHNRPLIRDMRSRYQQLAGNLPRTIAWETFNGFCRHYWPESSETPWVNPIGKVQRDRLI